LLADVVIDRPRIETDLRVPSRRRNFRFRTVCLCLEFHEAGIPVQVLTFV